MAEGNTPHITENVTVAKHYLAFREKLISGLFLIYSYFNIGFYQKNYPELAYNISNVYQSMGDNPHALEYYQKVLVIGEEVLGASYPEVATFYDKIGDVHSSMGDYPMFWNTITIQIKAFGNLHIDMALSCGKLGETYFLMDDYTKIIGELK